MPHTYKSLFSFSSIFLNIQARKTNSSSALGMLFDHGCDAINSAITPVTSGACFGLGWLHGWTYLTTCVFFAFFFQTWEEYYVGEMNLPFFNGPSEVSSPFTGLKTSI